MTDNIIQFPKPKSPNGVPQTRAEMEAEIREAREEYIGEVISEYTYDLLQFLQNCGIHFGDDKYGKDVAFIIEATRSLFCKKYNIDHPFQKISSTMFDKIASDHSIEYHYSNNEEE